MTIQCNSNSGRTRILGVCTAVAVLLHGLALAGVPWLAPSSGPVSTPEQGITIDLAPAPSQQSQQMAAADPEPPLPALPEPPPPDPEPEPAPSKPKPQKPQKHTVPRTAQRSQQTPRAAPTARTNTQGTAVQQATSPTPARGAHNPKPVYPELARKRGQEGTVRLLAHVDEQGRVTDLQIVQSSGWSMLDTAALKTVRRWRFEPALRGGMPVKGTVTVPVRFALK